MIYLFSRMVILQFATLKKTEGTVSTSSSYENHHETNSLDRPFPLQVADSRSAAAVPRLGCSTSRAFCYSPPWNLRRGGLGMPWGDGATAMHIFFCMIHKLHKCKYYTYIIYHHILYIHVKNLQLYII